MRTTAATMITAMEMREVDFIEASGTPTVIPGNADHFRFPRLWPIIESGLVPKS